MLGHVWPRLARLGQVSTLGIFMTELASLGQTRTS